MDRDAYLGRIGYRGGREPNAVNLAALVRAHRLAVPYETLDLWRRRRTTLRLEEIYDKVVTRRRGGYCFELNGLFAWLLRELGYNVREYAGRWLLGEPQSSVPMRRHRVVCVAIAGHPNQIADVGIGLPFMLSPRAMGNTGWNQPISPSCARCCCWLRSTARSRRASWTTSGRKSRKWLSDVARAVESGLWRGNFETDEGGF